MTVFVIPRMSECVNIFSAASHDLDHKSTCVHCPTSKVPSHFSGTSLKIFHYASGRNINIVRNE